MLTSFKKQTGFTLVELLIVIVVIAILAAVSIVAYSGIQNRAHDSIVQRDIDGMLRVSIQTVAVDDPLPEVYGSESETSQSLQWLNDNYRPTVDSYGQGFRFPLAAIQVNEYVGGQWVVKGMKISGISKSGKVFMASPEGGKSQAVTDWDDIISNIESDISNVQNFLANPPGWADSTYIQEMQERLSELESDLTSAKSSQQSGETLWELPPADPYGNRPQVHIPGIYTGGCETSIFIYDTEDEQWEIASVGNIC